MPGVGQSQVLSPLGKEATPLAVAPSPMHLEDTDVEDEGAAAWSPACSP